MTPTSFSDSLQQKDMVLDALNMFERENIDFSDALIAAEMSVENITEIYSYDRDFNRVAKIRRVEPEAGESDPGIS